MVPACNDARANRPMQSRLSKQVVEAGFSRYWQVLAGFFASNFFN